MKALDVLNLRVQRGNFLLHDVSFSVDSDEIFCVLGRTGAGKTVLLETLAGAYDVEPGMVSLYGKDMAGVPAQPRKVGFVYQDYGLFNHMTVKRNITYGLLCHNVSKEEASRQADQMMDLLAISYIANQYPQTISGGEKQRTAFARALVLQPRMLLLDEPFAALDPHTKKTMYSIVRDIKQRFSCPVVFVTHDFSEAQQLANRIGIILDGSLHAVVPSSQLFTSDRYYDDTRTFLGL